MKRLFFIYMLFLFGVIDIMAQHIKYADFLDISKHNTYLYANEIMSKYAYQYIGQKSYKDGDSNLIEYSWSKVQGEEFSVFKMNYNTDKEEFVYDFVVAYSSQDDASKFLYEAYKDGYVIVDDSTFAKLDLKSYNVSRMYFNAKRKSMIAVKYIDTATKFEIFKE